MREDSRVRQLLERVKAALRRKLSDPEPPEDPYAYVGAPKKPRLPHLSASAKASLE